MPSEVKFTQDFLEHAAVCTSQYDSTCRAMAAEILALRAEIAKPWEHSDHWRNPETGYIECSCCCDWALDAERDHKRIAALQSQLDALTWTEITPDNLPKKVFIGKDWNGLVTNGRVVFCARLYVSSYNVLSEERVLKWSGLEAHIGNDIHFEAITHYMELPNPPPPSGAKEQK
jgi:hypothetical protein